MSSEVKGLLFHAGYYSIVQTRRHNTAIYNTQSTCITIRYYRVLTTSQQLSKRRDKTHSTK